MKHITFKVEAKDEITLSFEEVGLPESASAEEIKDASENYFYLLVDQIRWCFTKTVHED